MFKRYDQKQQFLLPLNLEEFVLENHIARVLNDIIDVVDISDIESTYSEEGCPAYHPRLLLKILLYMIGTTVPIDTFIYVKCHVYIENKEMYNNLLLKTNFCF